MDKFIYTNNEETKEKLVDLNYKNIEVLCNKTVTQYNIVHVLRKEFE